MRNQRTLERADSYPNPNRRPIVSDLSLFCYANRLAAVLADISADSTNPVNALVRALIFLEFGRGYNVGRTPIWVSASS